MSTGHLVKTRFTWLPLACLACVAVLLCATLPTRADTPAPLTPDQQYAQLRIAWKAMATHFWRAEGRLALPDVYHLQGSFAPLSPDDPLRKDYTLAAKAATDYLTLCGAMQKSDRATATAAYLGGCAAFTLGDFPRALTLLSRVPLDYEREVYIGDNYLPDPEFNHKTRPGLSKLLFYCRLQTQSDKPADAFAALQQVTQAALETLTAQHEFAVWLANRPNPHYRRPFEEVRFGSEPDAYRASSLPATLALVEKAWDALLEKALQKAGAKALRAWLRGLSAPEAPLSQLALYRLQGIDDLVIKQYFATAQKQIDGKNFDGARATYKTLIAEYSGSATAERAQALLDGVKPIAVRYYAAEGKKQYQPQAAGQFGKPQDKAAAAFARLYAEAKDDPTLGSQANAALLGLSRAQATQGQAGAALGNVRKLLALHPGGDLEAAAQFQLGFLQGSNGVRKYDEAVAALEKVWNEHPRSSFAADALWYAAFYRSWQGKYSDGVLLLSKLQKEYPSSPRTKYAADWIAKFGQRAQ
jgi:TolA-binding protein